MPAIVLPAGKTPRSVLFSFVPKTGGTALLAWFRSLGARIFLSAENNAIASLLKCPTQHMHYALLDAFYRLDSFDFSFAIVRNPLDRARSDFLWQYRRNPPGRALPSFDQWVAHMLARFGEDPYTAENHFRPQHEFVGPLIGKVYRYEDGLQLIAEDVLARIGFFPTEAPPMPTVNAAGQHFAKGIRSSDIEISDRARRQLMAFYRQDFENFYPDLL